MDEMCKRLPLGPLIQLLLSLLFHENDRMLCYKILSQLLKLGAYSSSVSVVY